LSGGVFVRHRIPGTGLRGGFPVVVAGIFRADFQQRNSLVVGFVMGFTVIPIIFTIAEDSLSNVPPRCAAVRWRWARAAGKPPCALCCPRRRRAFSPR
jgi:hypothetical protein